MTVRPLPYWLEVAVVAAIATLWSGQPHVAGAILVAFVATVVLLAFATVALVWRDGAGDPVTPAESVNALWLSNLGCLVTSLTWISLALAFSPPSAWREVLVTLLAFALFDLLTLGVRRRRFQTRIHGRRS